MLLRIQSMKTGSYFINAIIIIFLHSLDKDLKEYGLSKGKMRYNKKKHNNWGWN